VSTPVRSHARLDLIRKHGALDDEDMRALLALAMTTAAPFLLS